MTENPIFLAVVVSVLYLGIWALYRIFRYREHRQLEEAHGKERILRAKFESEKLKLPKREDAERNKAEADEMVRRAEWDVKFGSLISSIDIKNREETRWPVSAALQVATTIFSGLLLSLLIWGSNGRHETPITMSPVAPIAPVVPVAPDFAFSYVALTVMACLGAGLALLLRAKSNAGRAIGIGLLATAPLVSGTKFVLVEKFGFSPHVEITASAKDKPKPEASGQPPAPEPPALFSFTMALPSFPEGSSTPDAKLRCVLHTLARDLAADPELSSIVVVGRADKRELKPLTRRKYASNWGLAQQRSACVQQVLTRTGLTPNKVLATIAGPVHTNSATSDGLLAKDRSVTVFVNGSGTKHSWSEGLSQGVELSRCDDGAILADDLCT